MCVREVSHLAEAKWSVLKSIWAPHTPTGAWWQVFLELLPSVAFLSSSLENMSSVNLSSPSPPWQVAGGASVTAGLWDSLIFQVTLNPHYSNVVIAHGSAYDNMSADCFHRKWVFYPKVKQRSKNIFGICSEPDCFCATEGRHSQLEL